jgi:elongator complex protein 1
VTCHTLEWEVIRSTASPPEDSGLVAVVDGSDLLLTPFRYQNVPPPMSSFRLSASQVEDVPLHVAFASNADILVATYPEGRLEAWRCFGQQLPQHLYSAAFPLHGATPYQVACSQQEDSLVVFLLCFASKADRPYRLFSFRLSGDGKAHLNWEESFSEKNRPKRIASPDSTVWLHQGDENKPLIRRFDGSFESNHSKLPDSPAHLQVVENDGISIPIALAHSGRLYAGDILVDSQVTSFVICGDFLVYTTSSHLARFILLSQLHPSLVDSLDVGKCESRRLERGSRIVTAVASTMSLVLQMPRGNLEIIYPRPLVLQVVRALLRQSKYKEAFIHCRKHRIDLNILYDEDPAAFIANLEQFVEQINEVDHLNLFLSSLK